MECLTDLIGLKALCDATDVTPLFWLDDIEGIDREKLAQVTANGSGAAFAANIIDGAARFLIADIETLIPKGYSIKSSLNSFCNVCTWNSVSTTLPETGIVIKSLSTTKNGYLSLDSLTVKIAATGNYNIVLHDGKTATLINSDFTAGVETVLTGIKYKTTSSFIRMFFLEPNVPVYALNCPVTKSCGCSGQTSNQSRDLQIKGLHAGSEFPTQYGFIPCASIVCSLDNVMCAIVNQQPRLFGVALLYRSAARYFSEFQVTTRNNKNASFDEDEKLSLADRYIELYYERLRGSGQVKGIADNMAAALNNLHDPCIECARQNSTAWATG